MPFDHRGVDLRLLAVLAAAILLVLMVLHFWARAF